MLNIVLSRCFSAKKLVFIELKCEQISIRVEVSKGVVELALGVQDCKSDVIEAKVKGRVINTMGPSEILVA